MTLFVLINVLSFIPSCWMITRVYKCKFLLIAGKCNALKEVDQSDQTDVSHQWTGVNIFQLKGRTNGTCKYTWDQLLTQFWCGRCWNAIVMHIEVCLGYMYIPIVFQDFLTNKVNLKITCGSWKTIKPAEGSIIWWFLFPMTNKTVGFRNRASIEMLI